MIDIPYNFFVLRDGGQNQIVQRIIVTQELQDQLTLLFSGQRGELLGGQPEQITFSGETLTAEQIEILVINNFPMPAIIETAAGNFLGTPDLIFTTEAAYEIRSVFAVVPTDPPEILFQAFDRRGVLAGQAGRFAIKHSEGTFQRMDSPTLVLDARLAATYQNGNLYFRSYQVAKRIFDLTPFYKESSNEEITEFLAKGIVGCTDPAKLIANIDSIGRKKLTLVRASTIFQDVDVATIVRRARKHKITIATERVNGAIRILFPNTRKELKDVLSFLNQDIYEAPLTKAGRFLSRSKVPMQE